MNGALKTACMLLILLFCRCLAAGEIALTFDDFPKLASDRFPGTDLSDELVEVLRSRGIQAGFYCVPGKKFEGDLEESLALLGRSGQKIGNHTDTHLNLNKVGAEAYVADLIAAHRRIKDLPGFFPSFRYPFSAEGRNRADQVRVRRTLDEIGYSLGYFTVENVDWRMNGLLHQALRQGREVDYDRLRKAYIKQTWMAIRFYDRLAWIALGRSTKHVLLLHVNEITVMFLDDLIEFLHEKGWRIIPVTEAYDDPISRKIPQGLNTQFRLCGIARDKGYSGDLTPDSNRPEAIESMFRKMKVFE